MTVDGECRRKVRDASSSIRPFTHVIEWLYTSSREVFLRVPLHTAALASRTVVREAKRGCTRVGGRDLQLVKYREWRKIVIAKKSSSITIKFNLGHRAMFDTRLKSHTTIESLVILHGLLDEASVHH